MAIYHLSAKVISRGKGKSATAAAAYRAGEKIADQRTGMTFDYSQRKGVYATEIIAPDHAPNWACNRSQLWNSVELFETRRNSRLAREFDIALPVELSHDTKRELVRNFVKEQLVSRSLVADLAFHEFNSHNPHVHIMLTTRRIEAEGFGAKERDLDKKDFLLKLRESWSEIANRALERAGHSEKIDHRTLEEQGINRIPQIHLGADVAAMMKREIATERGEEYLSIEAANQQIEALSGQIAAIERTIEVEKEVSKKETSKPNKAQAVDSPNQTTQTNRESRIDPSNALTQEESYSQRNSDESLERERVSAYSEIEEQLKQITDSLTSSSQRAEELVERLKKSSRKAPDLKLDSTVASREGESLSSHASDVNRETADKRNNRREPNRAAEDLTKEFQRLEERILSSGQKNLQAGKATEKGFAAITAQLGEKIKRLAKSILGEPEDTKQQHRDSSPTLREAAKQADSPQPQPEQSQPKQDEPNDSHLFQESPSVREQQQWVLSNYRTLLLAIGDDRKWRSSMGLPLHRENCQTTRGKYHLNYHGPTQTFTLTVNDGRGEILKTRIVDNQRFFWHTSLCLDDIQFLASLGREDRPVVGSLSSSDARYLYKEFKGNHAYGYATQWAAADKVAVQNALAAGLTQDQAFKVISKSPRTQAILSEYGQEQAKAYIIERISEATGLPLPPVTTSQRAKRLYSEYDYNNRSNDGYIARCAIDDGWTAQDLQAILTQSPLTQKRMQQQGQRAGIDYVNRIVEETLRWQQRKQQPYSTRQQQREHGDLEL